MGRCWGRGWNASLPEESDEWDEWEVAAPSLKFFALQTDKPSMRLTLGQRTRQPNIRYVPTAIASRVSFFLPPFALVPFVAGSQTIAWVKKTG